MLLLFLGYCAACWLIMFFWFYRAHLRWMHELITLVFAPLTLPLAFGMVIAWLVKSRARRKARRRLVA